METQQNKNNGENNDQREGNPNGAPTRRGENDAAQSRFRDSTDEPGNDSLIIDESTRRKASDAHIKDGSEMQDAKNNENA